MGAKHHQPFHRSFPTFLRMPFQASRSTRMNRLARSKSAGVVELVLNYRLLPDGTPEVYQKIGVNFANGIVLPAAQEVLKANTTKPELPDKEMAHASTAMV